MLDDCGESHGYAFPTDGLPYITATLEALTAWT